MLHEVICQTKRSVGKLRARACQRFFPFEKWPHGAKVTNHSCRQVFRGDNPPSLSIIMYYTTNCVIQNVLYNKCYIQITLYTFQKKYYTLFKIIHFSKKCIVKKKCIMYNTKKKCIIHYTVRKKVYNAPRWGESWEWGWIVTLQKPVDKNGS